MNIDMSQIITDVHGQVLKYAVNNVENDLTLRVVCAEALDRPKTTADGRPDFTASYKRGQLAYKVMDTKTALVDLDENDIVIIKEAILSRWQPSVVFVAHEMLKV